MSHQIDWNRPGEVLGQFLLRSIDKSSLSASWLRTWPTRRPRKKGPSFADMLTTLRRQSWQDKIRTLPIKSRVAKRALAQIIEFLRLAG